jgi:DNA-3-methyladenine glycosylase II
MNHIFTHFSVVDPALYEAALLYKEKIKPLTPLTDLNQFFPRLCAEIISQQLAGKAAEAIEKRFIALFPEGVTPEAVLAFPEQTYRDVGASWAKARYLRDAALQTKNGVVRYHEFDQLSDEEIIAELTQIKGVGRWTAEMFLMFTLGREDIFSMGDLGLRRGFQKLYGIEDEKQALVEMERVNQKWSPYRSYASLTLWAFLDNR